MKGDEEAKNSLIDKTGGVVQMAFLSPQVEQKG